MLEEIVVKSILVIPKRGRLRMLEIDRVGDEEKMFVELARHVLVARLFLSQLHCNRPEIETEHPHPARRIRLGELPSLGQIFAPVEYADVVEP